MNASTPADSAKIASDSAKVASDTGAFAKNVAGAASSSHSTLQRMGEAVAAAKLGTRVLPAAWRFAKRQPLGAGLAALALIATVYVVLPRIRSMRNPPGMR